MARRKALTMAEILDILEESDLSGDEENDIHHGIPDVVYIPPATVDAISDEEQGIDEDEMVGDIDPRLEIAGEVEIHFENGNEDFAGPSNALCELSACEPIYKKLVDFGVPKWKRTKRGEFELGGPIEAEMDGTRKEIALKLSTKTPYELFRCFFDDNVIALMVEQTNLYAAQNNVQWSVSSYEILRFIGILMFTGFHTVPRWDLYWSVRPEFGVKMVKMSLSRNRFRDIKRYIHLADNNNSDTSDRFAKVRPLLTILNERYMQWGVFSTYLSIDEQMIPYFGRHSCKMFIRGKPIRFGFKYWCLCSDDGYLYSLIPYGGASVAHNKNIGLGASVILNLLQNVEKPEQHSIHFDNFFTSYYLMCLLTERRFRATGTIRKNRMGGADDKLKGGKNLKKHEFDYLFDETNKILVTRWQDNAEVTIATNYVPVEPLAMAKRYDKKEKAKVSIPMPNVMAEYNKHMGGVDLHDNGVANYRVAVRGKKWWWPLFVNTINTTVVNAWKLHVMVCKIEKKKNLPQLEFKAEIARHLMFSKKSESDDDSGEISDDDDLPNFNLANHIVVEDKNKKRMRCKVCKSNSIFRCSKCNVSLHPQKCFETYHKNLKK